MSVRTLRLSLAALFVLLSSVAFAQVNLVRKGKPGSRIVLASSDANDLKAAELLQDFVQRISSARLPVVADVKPGKGDVVIGNGLCNKALVCPEITDDGFRIDSRNGIVRIVSGGGRGAIYGVTELLERALGVEYWGENEYSLTPSDDVVIPALEITQNPAFHYRQSQFYGMANDPIYKLWMRFELPEEVFAAKYWVHTFDKLMPSARYGKQHPEYYSFFGGKRHPGKASQWCLSNPDVLEIACRQIDSIFRAHPECGMIAVSQNDGNYTQCQCPECKAVDDYEGAHSGSVVRFVNKVAERFPDKQFATLAYLYTMQPPKHVRPRENVTIMLCDIDCKREVPLTENASGREFVEALEGWSAITDKIFVWDYGINFDNMVAPFPNFHILGENMQLFKKNHVTMHHSQIGSPRGGDFAELRSWMVSKLMWNPDADVDGLIHRFLDGYYGAAAPYIYQYIKIMEGALLASGKELWIYDSPVTHKTGMHNRALMRRYSDLFDRAEDAVRSDSVRLARVERSRLSLQFAELEIARTDTIKDFEDLTRKLDRFERQTARFGVVALNERGNTPKDYCRLYRERYMPRAERNIARGAKISFRDAPTQKRYRDIAERALTDELFGGQTFQDSWIGWEGIDAQFTLDLGEVKEVRSVETDFLHQIGAWVLAPLGVRYEFSVDGVNFMQSADYKLEEERANQVLFKAVKHEFEAPAQVRYIRITVEGTKICPHWHYGVGHPSWFFIDEVTVH